MEGDYRDTQCLWLAKKVEMELGCREERIQQLERVVESAKRRTQLILATYVGLWMTSLFIGWMGTIFWTVFVGLMVMITLGGVGRILEREDQRPETNGVIRVAMYMLSSYENLFLISKFRAAAKELRVLYEERDWLHEQHEALLTR